MSGAACCWKTRLSVRSVAGHHFECIEHFAYAHGEPGQVHSGAATPRVGRCLGRREQAFDGAFGRCDDNGCLWRYRAYCRLSLQGLTHDGG